MINMTHKFEKRSVFGKGVRPTKIYQRNNKLRKDIYFEIRQLNKTLHTGPRDSRHSVTIEKFIDAMIPSKNGPDPGRLPINANTSRAPKPNKILCVFYLVSCLVQSFWEYLKTESDEDLTIVKIGLRVLRDINRHYNIMHVEGNIREGWVLKI